MLCSSFDIYLAFPVLCVQKNMFTLFTKLLFYNRNGKDLSDYEELKFLMKAYQECLKG